jgi:hypothetical protein
MRDAVCSGPGFADDYVIRQASLPIRLRLDQTLLGRSKPYMFMQRAEIPRQGQTKANMDATRRIFVLGLGG